MTRQLHFTLWSNQLKLETKIERCKTTVESIVTYGQRCGKQQNTLGKDYEPWKSDTGESPVGLHCKVGLQIRKRSNICTSINAVSYTHLDVYKRQ